MQEKSQMDDGQKQDNRVMASNHKTIHEREL